MTYQIRISARAERDLVLIFETVHGEDVPAAREWFGGLKAAIRSLGSIPGRCPSTPEDKGLRHLLYGRKPHVYRVIYRIVEKKREVEILHIRHGARDSFDPAAL